MSIALPEIETVAWPEMDDLLPCEGFVNDEDCSRPAEWVIWRACCADRLKYKLHCTEHKDELLTSDEVLLCQFCNKAYVPARRICIYVEPLNKRG